MKALITPSGRVHTSMHISLFPFVFFLLSFVFPCALCQTPQGFTYQALAVNGSGEPIRNQALPVRITIQSDTLGGTIFWYEEHAGVTTNATGIFSLIVGKGSKISGTANTFTDIDWAVTPKYIKAEINNGTWLNMGSSRLWSIPYAMTAGDLTGSLKKLEVAGTATAMDEALFEVKNKNGQTVFAVYNEGVRIYVGDGSSKAVKGGFAIGSFDESKADTLNLLVVNKDSVRVYIYDDPLNKAVKGGFGIGGFDESKGITNDYMLVSPDSIRMYIDKDGTKAVKGGFAIGSFDESKAMGQEYLRVTDDSVRIYIDDQAKAVKGGFAIGGFDESKTGGKSFFDVNTSSTGIINPSENRILWYPLKNAFITGRILVENPDSVGENSFASGFESKAKGQYSQALGYQAIARGHNSTSIGYQSVAEKNSSFAFGQYAQARNAESYAIGGGAIAEGFRSYAFGSAGVDSAGTTTGVAYAKGNYSFAIGQGSRAIGTGSFAMGLSDTANADYSLSLGYKTSASGYGSTSIGFVTRASGDWSSALGYRSASNGLWSTSMGYLTTAIGNFSTAMGKSTIAEGFFSTAMGDGTTASGDWSVAMGYNTVASGSRSLSTGYQSVASGDHSTATGASTTADGDYSFAAGSLSSASGAYSAAFGNQTIASGLRSFAAGYLTTAGGQNSMAFGVRAYATGDNSFAAGLWAVAPSYSETVFGSYCTDYTPVSTTSFEPDDRLFVIGNGVFGSKRNALTVLKSGRIGLQSVTAPTYALELPNNSATGIGQARAYAWTTYSDGRAKTDRQPLSYGLVEVMQLKPQSYYHLSSEINGGLIGFKSDGVMDIGLIAQEVFNVIPEAVTRPVSEDSDLWSLSYDKIVPVLVKAIQQQQQIIEVQNTKLEHQQMEFDKLKAEVEALKAIITNGAR